MVVRKPKRPSPLRRAAARPSAFTSAWCCAAASASSRERAALAEARRPWSGQRGMLAEAQFWHFDFEIGPQLVQDFPASAQGQLRLSHVDVIAQGQHSSGLVRLRLLEDWRQAVSEESSGDWLSSSARLRGPEEGVLSLAPVVAAARRRGGPSWSTSRSWPGNLCVSGISGGAFPPAPASVSGTNSNVRTRVDWVPDACTGASSKRFPLAEGKSLGSKGGTMANSSLTAVPRPARTETRQSITAARLLRRR